MQVRRGADARRDDVTDADGKGARQQSVVLVAVSSRDCCSLARCNLCCYYCCVGAFSLVHERAQRYAAGFTYVRKSVQSSDTVGGLVATPPHDAHQMHHHLVSTNNCTVGVICPTHSTPCHHFSWLIVFSMGACMDATAVQYCTAIVRRRYTGALPSFRSCGHPPQRRATVGTRFTEQQAYQHVFWVVRQRVRACMVVRV